jgi:hypothetical protein
MVKITKIEDIDQNKLKQLFKKRGRAISTPRFSESIIDFLTEYKEDYEVFQCECGEVSYIKKEAAENIRKKLNIEDLKCFRCLGLTKNRIESQYFIRILKILQLLEKRKINTVTNSIEFDTEVFDEMKKNANGLFAANSVDEFYYGFNNFTTMWIDFFSTNDKEHFEIVELVYEEAIKKNPNLFEEFSKIFDPELFEAGSVNSFLVNKSIVQTSQDHFDRIFFGMEFNESTKVRQADLEKDLVNKKMTLHKNLIEEGRFFLDTLINLINVIEGRKIESNPFSKFKLPKLSPSGKDRQINGIRDKIELFKYHFSGNVLYPLLTEIYDTQLRNDEGHNQYKIDLKKRVVRSLIYNRDISFKELDQKNDKIQSFHSKITRTYHTKFIERKRNLVRNLGLEVGFCFENFEHLNGILIPKGNCMPIISLVQFWDFAYHENGKRYFPQIVLLPNGDFSIIAQIIDGAPILLDRNFTLDMWFSLLLLKKEYKIILATIAPTLPWFNHIAIDTVPINQFPEVNILSINEKVVKVPETEFQRILNIVRNSENS